MLFHFQRRHIGNHSCYIISWLPFSHYLRRLNVEEVLAERFLESPLIHVGKMREGLCGKELYEKEYEEKMDVETVEKSDDEHNDVSIKEKIYLETIGDLFDLCKKECVYSFVTFLLFNKE